MREFLLPSLARGPLADEGPIIGEFTRPLIARKLLEVARIEGTSRGRPRVRATSRSTAPPCARSAGDDPRAGARVADGWRRLDAFARARGIAVETSVRPRLPDRSESLGSNDQLLRSVRAGRRDASRRREAGRGSARLAIRFERRAGVDQRSADAAGGAGRKPRADCRPTRMGRLESSRNGRHGRLRRAGGDGPAHGTRRLTGRSGVVQLSVLNGGCTVLSPNTERGESRVTLWSGRFDTAPDPAAFDFGISFGFDRALFEDDVTGSIAWAQALAAADVLSSEDTSAIVKALRDILEQGRRDPSWVAGPDEDVHSFVERQLVDRIGDAGRRLHTAVRATSRSRSTCGCISVVVSRCFSRRWCGWLGRAPTRRNAAGAAMMPSYTHLRRAQPVLVAHSFSRTRRRLRRDHARLAMARRRKRIRCRSGRARSPARATASTRPACLARSASRVVVSNSMDASSDRDFVATFLYAISLGWCI